REPEIRGQVAADLVPRVASIVAAHDVPVFLHVEHIRARWVHRDAVDAVADLGIRVGDVFRMQTMVDWLPRRASVVGPEGTRGRDRDVDPLGIARIPHDRVQAHPARAWLPGWP